MHVMLLVKVRLQSRKMSMSLALSGSWPGAAESKKADKDGGITVLGSCISKSCPIDALLRLQCRTLAW